jgi:hypothetical protein
MFRSNFGALTGTYIHADPRQHVFLNKDRGLRTNS